MKIFELVNSLVPGDPYQFDPNTYYGKREFRELVREIGDRLVHYDDRSIDKEDIKESVGEVLYAIDCLENDSVQYQFAQENEVVVIKIFYKEMELLCSDYCRFNPMLSAGVLNLLGAVAAQMSRTCEIIGTIETIPEDKRLLIERTVPGEIASMMDSCDRFVTGYDNCTESTLYVMDTGPIKKAKKLIATLNTELANELKRPYRESPTGNFDPDANYKFYEGGLEDE